MIQRTSLVTLTSSVSLLLLAVVLASDLALLLAGKCVVGTRVWDMKPLDLCYTCPWDVHQFYCPEEEKESFAFFCIVNAVRDRPVLVDPNGQEMAGLAGSCG